MLEIILVRHGETDWNAGEIFRGQADVPLNGNGLKQAALLGRYLVREKIDIIYSSPLVRALKTAAAIAGPQRLDVNVVSNLIDIDCGEWQGLTVDQVNEKYPMFYRDWLDTPEQVRIPGGESLAEVRARVEPFIEDALVRCGEGRLAFVSHRVVHKVLICALLGLDNSFFWSIKLDTGGITRFEYNRGRAVLTGHNDTSYLRRARRVTPADF
ncbi:MAG: hypothetical protein A2Z29_06485 [Chloroflexi bacterium RBG_16_56_11]|nr:MAG: hypothetical protein A2Z29_06485 [Chloroflexi bacterium RBG_16_56_11]